MNDPKKITNWKTLIFLSVTPVIALVATIYYVTTGMSNTATWVLTAIMFTTMGLATTAGYHRLFSHRNYSAPWPVRLWFLIFGAAAWQGTALEWSIDHREHHRYVDTERDPYSINKGFWSAHMLWLFYVQPRVFNPAENQDLYADKLIVWQHKHSILIGSFFSFIFPALIAGFFWGDWFGGFFIAGVLRAVLTNHATFCINSVAHSFGKQPYSQKHSARDNWLNAFITWGEGYHNYHHEFAADYRNGVRWWHFDPTKWLIYSLSRLRLATDLKRASPQRILKKRMSILQPMNKAGCEMLPSSGGQH